MGFFSLLMSAFQTRRSRVAALPTLVDEQWEDLADQTQESSGNRATLADLANYLAGVKTTTANETAERFDVVLPDAFTIIYEVNKTAAWTHAATGAFIQFLADADARNAGLQNFASSGTEDGYSVLIFQDTIQAYEINAGSYSQRATAPRTLAEGVTEVRVTVVKGASVVIKVWEGTTLRVDYTDASPPAGLGTGFLVGFSNAQTSQKAHIGRVRIYAGDLGAPS